MQHTAENTPGLAWKAIDEVNWESKSVNGFDYRHQAWVENGRYLDCGHEYPENGECGCYGRIHQGEPIAPDAEIH